MKIYEKHGKWYRQEEGKDIQIFNTEEEAKGSTSTKPEELVLQPNSKFSSADSNNDGVLTDEELESYLEE